MTYSRELDRQQIELPIRTRVGGFLDRSSLESLSIFINLLRGELALVGPPPQRVKAHGATHSVRPGIFSWQGLVAMGGTDIELAEAMRRDRARSFRSDLRLLSTLFRFELLGRSSSS
jgi:lipopolysaccharide/colanic/teichoic acid biosynthesis glycosyltransferase